MMNLTKLVSFGALLFSATAEQSPLPTCTFEVNTVMLVYINRNLGNLMACKKSSGLEITAGNLPSDDVVKNMCETESCLDIYHSVKAMNVPDCIVKLAGYNVQFNAHRLINKTTDICFKQPLPAPSPSAPAPVPSASAPASKAPTPAPSAPASVPSDSAPASKAPAPADSTAKPSTAPETPAQSSPAPTSDGDNQKSQKKDDDSSSAAALQYYAITAATFTLLVSTLI